MAAIPTNSKLPLLLTRQDQHFNSGLWVWIVWNLGIEYGFIQSSGCMLARFWAYGKAFTIKLMCWFYNSALPLFTLHISWETWKIKELWQNRNFSISAPYDMVQVTKTHEFCIKMNIILKISLSEEKHFQALCSNTRNQPFCRFALNSLCRNQAQCMKR